VLMHYVNFKKTQKIKNKIQDLLYIELHTLYNIYSATFVQLTLTNNVPKYFFWKGDRYIKNQYQGSKCIYRQ